MRKAAALLHVSSLPSRFGIGSFLTAYPFIDFLRAAGFKAWQVLPLNITGYGDSPYQSVSVFAGNPYFIDLTILKRQGLLKGSDFCDIDWGSDRGLVDFGKVYSGRKKVLNIAVQNFRALGGLDSKSYIRFKERNSFWLDDFAAFMAIKQKHDGAAFHFWQHDLKIREPRAVSAFVAQNSEIVEFYKICQFWFFEQWAEVRAYAQKNGIEIIGDMPFYVSLDSADVWANPQNFVLNEQLLPIEVAGVPPDAFSEDGQLWGNPLYNFAKMREDGYAFFKARFDFLFEMVDTVRIDHFRAFSAYYSIQAQNKTAKGGRWIKGEGKAFFEKLGLMNSSRIIVEDLGVSDDDLVSLLNQLSFPTMKVVQFAFDGDCRNPHLVDNHVKNCVAYLGTHDNDTTKGWFLGLAPHEKRRIKSMINYRRGSISSAMIRHLLSSKAELVVLSMQDLLDLGSVHRMNTPSTDKDNWRFRLMEMPKTALANRVKRLLKKV